MFDGVCSEDADPDAVLLAKDVSGNFVVQKLFDIGRCCGPLSNCFARLTIHSMMFLFLMLCLL